jgi:pimeloyl-ACP methyl ester carboxylesterase
MNRAGTPLLILLLTALPASALPAQDFAGVWQGRGSNGSRTVLKLERAGTDRWSAVAYAIDKEPDGFAGSVVVNGSAITIVFFTATYVGNLSADGASITGAWIERYGQPGRDPEDFRRATKTTEWPLDVASHTIRFVTVDTNVTLEVLDWGGTGRPLVLLSGGGNSAHRYDRFAPKLTATYHVYGITRRGLGASSVPPFADGNYLADRLGEDLLAVMDSLKLQRPVLVGHSFAGAELSSVCSQHPERIAGLIYLDAGYSYAFYDTSRGDLLIDVNDLQRTLDQLSLQIGPREQKRLTDELLETLLPLVERDLRRLQKELHASPDTTWPRAYQFPAEMHALLKGAQKYTNLRCPALAFYAVPQHDSADAADMQAQATAFERGVPAARVVRLTNATHWVWESNEADVLREMSAFIGRLRE